METISIYWVAPFVFILLAIAILPLAVPHFWEKNKNKALVSLGISLPTAVYLLMHDPYALLHTGHEYFSFISILAALFVVSGGISLDGDLQATPKVNTAFLAIGTVLASIENDDLRADLLQKEAALGGEQAKLKALQGGTRPEELAVTESSVASASSTFVR